MRNRDLGVIVLDNIFCVEDAAFAITAMLPYKAVALSVKLLCNLVYKSLLFGFRSVLNNIKGAFPIKVSHIAVFPSVVIVDVGEQPEITP